MRPISQIARYALAQIGPVPLFLGVFGLIILAVVGPGLNPVSDFYTGLLAINTLLRVFVRLILFIWAFVFGSSLLGLLLILWGTRRKLEPERLDRIVTSHDAVSRYNYRGQKESRILWRDVQATLSIERTLWRRPIPLLSEFWLFCRLWSVLLCYRHGAKDG